MSAERILITGDVLRVDERGLKSQTKNISWFRNLLGPILQGVGLELSTRLATEQDADQFSREIYAAAGMRQNIQNWAMIYDSSPNLRQLALIGDVFHGSLVIGFELPDFLLRSFIEAGVDYIDFTLSPVRFAHDLFFCMRSSREFSTSFINQYRLHPASVELEAGFIKACIAQQDSHIYPRTVDNMAVFCCQTPCDRNLINNGKFIRAEDFKDKFAEINDRHDLILVREHPYNRNDKTAKYLINNFKNFKITDENIYELMCVPSIVKVISFSSSVLYEAPYFGLESENLIDSPLQFTSFDIDKFDYFNLGNNIFQVSFWLQISSELGLNVSQCQEFNFTPNIRKSLKQLWGADKFYKI